MSSDQCHQREDIKKFRYKHSQFLSQYWRPSENNRWEGLDCILSDMNLLDLVWWLHSKSLLYEYRGRKLRLLIWKNEIKAARCVVVHHEYSRHCWGCQLSAWRQKQLKHLLSASSLNLNCFKLLWSFLAMAKECILSLGTRNVTCCCYLLTNTLCWLVMVTSILCWEIRSDIDHKSSQLDMLWILSLKHSMSIGFINFNRVWILLSLLLHSYKVFVLFLTETV